jgi:acetyl esterase/lipase
MQKERFAAAKMTTPHNHATTDEGEVVVEEHSYGTGPRHNLDLYRPATDQKKRVVLVWVHGGAWVDRSKAEFANLGRGLVKASGGSLSVAVLNYHLSPRTRPPTHVFPAHVLDIAQALQWYPSATTSHQPPPPPPYLPARRAPLPVVWPHRVSCVS